MKRAVPLLILGWFFMCGLQSEEPTISTDPRNSLPPLTEQLAAKTYVVSEILSPSLFKFESGDTIRLIGVKDEDSDQSAKLAKTFGIDPDWFASYDQKTRHYLKQVLLGRPIALELDPMFSYVRHRDQNGHLFAYVFFKPSPNDFFSNELCESDPFRPTVTCDQDSKLFFLNAILIQNGFVRFDQERHMGYEVLLERAAKRAKKIGKGIWLKYDGHNLVREDGTIWVGKTGVQCEEQMDEKRATLYRNYFKTHGMIFHELQLTTTDGLVCSACSCLTQDLLLVRIDPEAMDAFVTLGFEPTLNARDRFLHGNLKRVEKDDITVPK